MKHFKHRGMTALLLALMLALAACGSSTSGLDDYKYGDLSKYIKLGEYKGVTYKKTDLNVSDKEIKDSVDSALKSGAETEEVKSGTVKEDSVVNIDYVGSIDGVEFEGGTAQGQELDIANSSYIKGFAEGIVGHEVGETFDLHVTFPENYGKEELNGKDAVFKTTINFIVKTKTPEYTDDWVKKNTDYSSKADYEASIRKDLESQKKSQAEANEQNEVFTKISDASEVLEYPEKELKAREEKIKLSYKNAAEQAGVSLEDYLSQNMGMDTEMYNQMVKSSSEQTVKSELILHAIAKEEGIEFSKDDYKEYLSKDLASAGYTEEQFKSETGKSLEEYAEENNLYIGYMYKTVMAKVMEYSKAE